MIKVTELRKSYKNGVNTFDALKGLDLEINQGTSIAIVGKSGSGKSTLMHLLAGLDTPTSGDVTYEDKSLAKMNEKELANFRNEKIGFVFQQFFLQPNLTVLENVLLPLKIAGLSKQERKQKAMEALQQVGLEDKAGNLAVNLSGGQKQRVCIARAIVTKPSVIFADEPTGNLDSETGEKVIELLFDLNQKLGITLVVVTHDMDLAKKCKEKVFIKDGQIVKEGAIK